MMLRCAARINSGSACDIAFKAASWSPRLIASSTVRTAPRICVRRDLLIRVRRAILRVAFLAEVVLAMVSNILRVDRSLFNSHGSASAASKHVIDAAGCFRKGLFEMHAARAGHAREPAATQRGVLFNEQCRAPRISAARRPVLLKEQRRRDCARGHRRPYGGRALQRQRFPSPPGSAGGIVASLSS